MRANPPHSPVIDPNVASSSGTAERVDEVRDRIYSIVRDLNIALDPISNDEIVKDG